MDKYTILSEIFEVENISEKIDRCPKITAELLLETISSSSYNLKKSLNISATTVTRYLSVLFPDRPSGTNKVCNYLLDKYGYKHCKKCDEVKESESFYTNASHGDGLSSYCKSCQAALEKPTAAHRAAKYKASKLLRTPAWVGTTELEQIAGFYRNCPNGYQVDHIVPLQGDTVSGLHVLSNLQYLTISENASKKNKYLPS
jgi:hypothetical protein